MSDDTQRRGLIRDLARRLELAGLGEIRVIDRVLQRLERLRDGARGRRWERPADQDERWFHLARAEGGGSMVTLCRGRWPAEPEPKPASIVDAPLTERCSSCLHHAGDGDDELAALAALIHVMRREDDDRADLREAARAEMLGEDETAVVGPFDAIELGGEAG